MAGEIQDYHAGSPWRVRRVVKFQTQWGQFREGSERMVMSSVWRRWFWFTYRVAKRKCPTIISTYESETQEDKVRGKNVIGTSTTKVMLAWVQCGFNRIKTDFSRSRDREPRTEVFAINLPSENQAPIFLRHHPPCMASMLEVTSWGSVAPQALFIVCGFQAAEGRQQEQGVTFSSTL